MLCSILYKRKYTRKGAVIMGKNAVQKAIEKTMIDVGITKTELARRLGTSPQNLCRRLNTGKFSYDELVAIASALGCNYIFAFEPAPAVENQ